MAQAYEEFIMNMYNKAFFALLIILAIAPVACMADQLNVQNTLAKGDIFTISGNMDNSGEIQIWVLGKNYWNGATAGQATVVPADATGAFSYQLSETSNMASGMYYIITQAPGPDGVFNVTAITENGVGFVKQDGLPAFIILGPGSLQGCDAALALKYCIDSPSVDDTYLSLTTAFEEPWIMIDATGDHYVGDTLTLEGTTNLAEGNTLNIDIKSPGYSAVGTTKVVSDGAYRIWSYSVDTTSWISGEYTVTVTSNNPSPSSETSFSLISVPATASVQTQTQTATPTPTPTAVNTPTPTPTPTATPTPTPTATPTPTPTAINTPTATATPVPTVVQTISSDEVRYEELKSEIVALNEQIDEKDSEIEQKNSVIDALINLFKALFGIDN